MANEKKDLKSLLIEEKVTTPENIAACLAKQQGKEKRHIIDLLLEFGQCDHAKLLEI